MNFYRDVVDNSPEPTPEPTSFIISSVSYRKTIRVIAKICVLLTFFGILGALYLLTDTGVCIYFERVSVSSRNLTTNVTTTTPTEACYNGLPLSINILCDSCSYLLVYPGGYPEWRKIAAALSIGIFGSLFLILPFYGAISLHRSTAIDRSISSAIRLAKFWRIVCILCLLPLAGYGLYVLVLTYYVWIPLAFLMYLIIVVGKYIEQLKSAGVLLN